MRLISSFGLLVAFSAAAASSDRQQPEEETADGGGTSVSKLLPEIAVVESNKSYIVKLDCVQCPFAVWDSSTEVSWQTPPQDNALILNFDIDAHGTALLLNGRRILPLDPMPLDIRVSQVASNQTFESLDITDGALRDGLSQDPQTSTTNQKLWLQYEHSLLRDKDPRKFWVQFDVTGWILEETIDRVHMDKEGQKLVQMLLSKESNENELRIEDIQVVERKDRIEPYRMKCGKLAIVQTVYDPSEWDRFGKLGTSSRLGNLVLGKLGDFWYEHLQANARIFLLALWLAITVFLVRRWHHARQQEKDLAEEDAEIALPSYQYSAIPVIKIEEYD